MNLYGWLSKLWSLFGSLIYCTYYFGYTKRDPNFDNHPYKYRPETCSGRFRVQGVGSRILGPVNPKP